MRYPSDRLPAGLAERLRGKLGLPLLGLLALALGAPMRAHSDVLINAASPFGILSLQFTCAAEAARTLLAGWDATALRHARLSLAWDSAFAPAYGLALAMLSERLARPAGGPGAPVFAWLPLWAATCDLLENLCHALLLGSDADTTIFALPACGFACIKWGLLALWSAMLAGLAWRGPRGRRAGR